MRRVDRNPPDVLVLELPGQVGQLSHLRGAQVGAHVVLQRAEQRKQPRNRVQREDALPDGQHDELLASRAVEIGGGLAGAGVLQRPLAVELLPTGIEVDVHHPRALAPRVAAVVERRRHVELNAAEGIDDVAERLEIDADPVVDPLPDDLRNGGRRQVPAAGCGFPVAAHVRIIPAIGADRIGAIELAHHDPVVGEGGNLDPEITGKRDHGRFVCSRADREHHDGVGQIGAIVSRPSVSKQQDVDPLVVLDLPAKRARLVGLGMDQRDQVGRLGTRGNRVNGRPDAEHGQPREKEGHSSDHGHRRAARRPDAQRAERGGRAPPARLRSQLKQPV